MRRPNKPHVEGFEDEEDCEEWGENLAGKLWMEGLIEQYTALFGKSPDEAMPPGLMQDAISAESKARGLLPYRL